MELAPVEHLGGLLECLPEALRRLVDEDGVAPKQPGGAVRAKGSLLNLAKLGEELPQVVTPSALGHVVHEQLADGERGGRGNGAEGGELAGDGPAVDALGRIGERAARIGAAAEGDEAVAPATAGGAVGNGVALVEGAEGDECGGQRRGGGAGAEAVHEEAAMRGVGGSRGGDASEEGRVTEAGVGQEVQELVPGEWLQ
jgi:hypothetical protein